MSSESTFFIFIPLVSHDSHRTIGMPYWLYNVQILVIFEGKIIAYPLFHLADSNFTKCIYLV